jgi:iduronate 2-sulfatase
MSKMSRRSFLSAAAITAAPLIGFEKRRRNVLFLASDDLNESLSCYGHPLLRTPSIDRIAAAGVRFTRAYCQFPLCSPSRTSLMTGLSPDTTGVYDLRTHFRDANPDVVTLPQLFRKNGYYAGRVGKIYHYGVPSQIGTDGLDDRLSWDRVVNPSGVDKKREEPLLTNYTPQRGIGSSISFHASSAPAGEHTDGLVAAETIQMLEEHKDDAFFIAAGFYRPHVPWIAPSKYFDRFPLDRIQLPRFDEEEMRMAPELAYFTRPAHWGMNDRQRREAMRAYYASIAFLDDQVGRVLGALDKFGLAQNTTIVFWSDHGYQLGEHGQWMKQTLFEAAARVPMIIGGDGVGARGASSSRSVELLDLYPTLAGLCSLNGTPQNLHGSSLVPLLGNPRSSWDKPAITQVRRGKTMGYSLRTGQYRYTRWGDAAQSEELYDYESDPREVQNLAVDPQSLTLRKQLRSRLEPIRVSRGYHP